MELGVYRGREHSLQPDFYNGWRLNVTAPKFKQFPIYFTNPSADMLSKSLTSFGHAQKYRVVYMGPRHTSNYKAYKAYCRNYDEADEGKEETEQYGEPYSKYEFTSINEKEKVFLIRSIEYRIFVGMNPTVKREDLRFDSNFQCGNLDLAISVSAFEYDLLMRVDSNTKGHTSWFYFKVSNFSAKQKVKFNIINYQKSGLLYREGMRPYCFRSSKKEWKQEGSNVEFKPKRFRYSLQDDVDPTIMNCLSFTYDFDSQDQYVYFAYCIPYSYSYLMHRVEELQKMHPNYVQIEHSAFSAGGLSIPLLTVTNSNSNSVKPVCLAIGRLHPGQTQGSWVMDGFMNYLCSSKGYYLRQKYMFKIIPMVNVDGVILGNFRTGIAGRDLNRVFDIPQRYEQVSLIRSLAHNLKPQIFLDFHGHSGKKNVFMYGPDYKVQHRHYLTCRFFPKIVSKLSNAFRFYSCIFRVSESKKTTGRAIMLKQHEVPFAFTIESSSHAYGTKNEEIIFTGKEYMTVGEKIAESLGDFIKIVSALPKRLEARRQTQENEKLKGSQKSKSPKKQDQFNSNLLSLEKMRANLNPEYSKLVQELIRDEREMNNNPTTQDQGEDSDFEEGEDYSEKQLKRMMKQDKSSEGPDDQSKKNRIKILITPKKEVIKRFDKSQRDLKLEGSQKSVNLLKSRHKSSRQEKKKEHRSLRTISPILIEENLKEGESRNNSSTLRRNLSSIEQVPPPEQKNLNQIRFSDWKKTEEQPLGSSNNELRLVKASSVSHVTIDYDINNHQEHERKPKKGKRRLNHRDRDVSKYQKLPEEVETQRIKAKKDCQAFYIKQSLLPLLNKNKYIGRDASPSLLQQILDNHEKTRKNYLRRDIKIIYF